MVKAKTAVKSTEQVQSTPLSTATSETVRQPPKKLPKKSQKKAAAAPVQAAAAPVQAATVSSVAAAVAKPVITAVSAEEPPHSCKIMWVKGVVRVVVNLHKISEKCINFTPTADRFYLDTFKHTKKYKLDFIYPQSVQVDASNPEATLEMGILKTDLKIVNWGEAVSQHAEIVSNHKGMLKARGIKGVDSNDEKQAGHKPKASQGNEKKQAPPSESKSATLTKKKTTPSSTEAKSATSAKPTAQKTQKSIITQSTASATTTEPKKKETPSKKQPVKELLPLPVPVEVEAKSEPSDAKPKKKKRFLEKSEMSDMLGKIVNEAESKTKKRLQQDEINSTHIEEVLQSKKQKQENRQKRKLEGRALLASSIKRKKDKPQASSSAGRKVNFAS